MTGLVTKYFHTLFATKANVDTLKQTVLQLAVMGKLVPQDSDEESAEQLLIRIAKVNTSLRHKRPPPNGHSLPKPYDLPTGWCWTTLPEVGELARGKSKHRPRNDPALYSGGTIPLVQTGDVARANGVIYTSTGKYNSIGLAQSRLWPRGTMCITIAANIADSSILGFDACFPDSVVGFIPSLPEVDVKYFDYFLRTAKADIQKFAPSTAQKNINLEILGSIFVPLPPAAEMKRIVAKVDELMALCDRLEADQATAEAAHAQLVQALLDSLTQATDAADFSASWQRLSEHFHTLFTTEASIDSLKQTVLQLAVMGKLVPQIKRDGSAMDLLASIAPVGKRKTPINPAVDENLPAVPPSWCWIRIADLAHVGTGATPSRTNPAYFDPPEISWVTSGETSQAFVRSTDQKVSSLALNETNLTVYPAGTLVVAMYGQGKTRGQVTELLIEACTNQACAAIQLICDDSAHRKFVKYFFEKSYDELRSLAAGGAQPNLNLGKIKETLIPLPPLPEQHRIVAKVDELMALCDQLKAQLAEARQQHAQLATALVEQAVA